jgi:hypothetical protein
MQKQLQEFVKRRLASFSLVRRAGRFYTVTADNISFYKQIQHVVCLNCSPQVMSPQYQCYSGASPKKEDYSNNSTFVERPKEPDLELGLSKEELPTEGAATLLCVPLPGVSLANAEIAAKSSSDPIKFSDSEGALLHKDRLSKFDISQGRISSNIQRHESDISNVTTALSEHEEEDVRINFESIARKHDADSSHDDESRHNEPLLSIICEGASRHCKHDTPDESCASEFYNGTGDKCIQTRSDRQSMNHSLEPAENATRNLQPASTNDLAVLRPNFRVVTDACAICLSDFEECDQVTWASNKKCPHVFHTGCISSWLGTLRLARGVLPEAVIGCEETIHFVEQQLSCPVCRSCFVDASDILAVISGEQTFSLGAVTNNTNADNATSPDGSAAENEVPRT